MLQEVVDLGREGGRLRDLMVSQHTQSAPEDRTPDASGCGASSNTAEGLLHMSQIFPAAQSFSPVDTLTMMPHIIVADQTLPRVRGLRTKGWSATAGQSPILGKPWGQRAATLPETPLRPGLQAGYSP